MSIDFRMTSTTLLGCGAARGDLVREGRPVEHRHASVRPRVSAPPSTRRGKPARITRRSAPSPARSARWPSKHLGTRTDVVPVPSSTTPWRHGVPPRYSNMIGGSLESAGAGQDDGSAGGGGARLHRHRREVVDARGRSSTISVTTKGITTHPAQEVEELAPSSA